MEENRRRPGEIPEIEAADKYEAPAGGAGTPGGGTGGLDSPAGREAGRTSGREAGGLPDGTGASAGGSAGRTGLDSASSGNSAGRTGLDSASPGSGAGSQAGPEAGASGGSAGGQADRETAAAGSSAGRTGLDSASSGSSAGRADMDGAAPETGTGSQADREETAAQRRRAKKEAKRKAFIEEVVSWVKSFVIMFCVALFLTRFIIINAVIPSGSMEDTIMTHDRLIGARFSYWFAEPERGDIVIFHYPVDEKRIYIKRIVGLPGETVRIRDSGIYINDSDQPLPEGYLKEEWEVMNTDFEFHVPENSYLMLGDNRNWSEDARYWAENAVNEGLADTMEEAEPYSYVRKDKILGKAIFTYFRKFRILRHGEWYE